MTRPKFYDHFLWHLLSESCSHKSKSTLPNGHLFAIKKSRSRTTCILKYSNVLILNADNINAFVTVNNKCIQEPSIVILFMSTLNLSFKMGLIQLGAAEEEY